MQHDTQAGERDELRAEIEALRADDAELREEVFKLRGELAQLTQTLAGVIWAEELRAIYAGAWREESAGERERL